MAASSSLRRTVATLLGLVLLVTAGASGPAAADESPRAPVDDRGPRILTALQIEASGAGGGRWTVTERDGQDDVTAERVVMNPRSRKPTSEPTQEPTSEPTEPDGTTDTEEATSPDTSGRWGLHHTAEEVAVWRDRAASGPYRTRGDVSTNSPGDWERVTANAEAFRAAPQAALWDGPDGALDTCVQQGHENNPPTDGPTHLRDAAFVAMVTGDTALADAVSSTLLEQVRTPGTDFRNTDRWCTGVLADVDPSYPVAQWATRVLYAFDYLGPDHFTAAEVAEVDAWLAAGAELLATDLDNDLDNNFPDRLEDDYTLSSSRQDDPGCTKTHYLDGPANCTVHRYYNNRRATIARFVGEVGVHQSDPELTETAARFGRELVAYGVFADGTVADMYRWTSSLPDLGWAYAANTVASVVVLADAMARAGDDSLYQYVTSAGANGSEGGDKSLGFAVRSLQEHVTGEVVRHATTDPADVGTATRIDGVHAARDWHGLHDVTFAVANRWLQDDDVAAVYERRADGYPRYPASNGPHSVWTGEGGIFPGVLFMFGGMEEEPSPFPAR